jgi:hypothetical protein
MENESDGAETGAIPAAPGTTGVATGATRPTTWANAA